MWLRELWLRVANTSRGVFCKPLRVAPANWVACVVCPHGQKKLHAKPKEDAGSTSPRGMHGRSR